MAIKKISSGWQVDIQPGGRGQRRVRKTFPTKAEAQRFENKIRAQHADGTPYLKPQRDDRTVSDLVDLWYTHHGMSLKSGKERVRSLKKVAQALGNPKARHFTSQTWAEYRTERIKGVSPISVNHEHTYLKAVFSELGRLGLWDQENPLARIRLLRVTEKEMAFLYEPEIRTLLTRLKSLTNRDCYYITCICLSTGARWSEAETLRAENLRPDRVTFVDTKSGKNRTVPIDQHLAGQIRQRKRSGRLFGNAYKVFGQAIEDSKIQLPPGQLTHVLRHTFASHFMMNGGNILVLQRILGHQSLAMTMRYAHFAPNHLEEAVKLNPLARLTLG